jgi:CRP/FNR family cyclic AMP-dependent transcriptional regulator
VLDRRVAVVLAAWPEITAAILDRMMARSRWLALHLAIAHLRRVESRVHVALWHFADRWGHVGPGGVALRLDLTHAQLADMVAAERPSVTLALSALRERGLVERDADHVWHLHGSPPGELDEVRTQATGPLR